jgi:hypothetical protein
MHISGMHQHVQDEPLRVGHQMSFAAGDPLAAIVATHLTRFAGARGLAVFDRCVRLRIAAG